MKNSNFVIRQGQLNRYAHPRREVIVPQNDKIQLFEDKRIRTVWNEEKEDWYFSISENIVVARAGGKVAGDARKAIEAQTGVPVITDQNASQLGQIVANILEETSSGNQDENSDK